jgi:hypothetical protein
MPQPRGFDEGDLGSVTKGKQGEFVIIGKILLKGHKVYLPVVDTGIDFLVDVGKGHYKEIQVKSRDGNPTFSVRNFKPRENFIIVCYLRGKNEDDFWIIPSKIFKQIGNLTKLSNRETIRLNIGREGSPIYNKLAQYHGNWGILLSGATSEVRKEVESTSRRVEIGDHLTKSELEEEILVSLALGVPAGKTVQTTKEILGNLEERFKNKFDLADLAVTGGDKVPRWRKNAGFALYGMKPKGWVKSVGPGKWTITRKGADQNKHDLINITEFYDDIPP